MGRIIGELERAFGKGRMKVYAGAVSVVDGDTIDTGLKSIDFCKLEPTAPNRSTSVSVTGGVITVGLKGGTENIVHAACTATGAAYATDTALATVQSDAAITVAESVYVLAIGDPR